MKEFKISQIEFGQLAQVIGGCQRTESAECTWTLRWANGSDEERPDTEPDTDTASCSGGIIE